MVVKKSDSSLASLLQQVDAELLQNASRFSEIRRHLHRHPELSGQEFETTAYLSRQLAEAGIPHRLGPGERGVITDIIPGAEPGSPVVAMRADIDALPINEESEATYRSSKPNIMHACGHDAHTAILLGTALALHKARALPAGWRCIFQPSEEIGRGAREMVGHGALEGVNAILALHVDPSLPFGNIRVPPGPRTAFCQDFVIEVQGRGGHGARPHSTIDPIAVAAHLITLIYQAIPRQTDARDPVVATIGSLNGGTAANVIPDLVIMKGTIRTLQPAVAAHTRLLIKRLCSGTAQAFKAKVSPSFDELLPGLVNDSWIAAHFAACARVLLGRGKVSTAARPSMGAEDFADYLPLVPGCMTALGVGSRADKVTPLHTPAFDIDERALVLGARLLARVLLAWPVPNIGSSRRGRKAARIRHRSD
jgi:amidohydrolase